MVGRLRSGAAWSRVDWCGWDWRLWWDQIRMGLVRPREAVTVGFGAARLGETRYGKAVEA